MNHATKDKDLEFRRKKNLEFVSHVEHRSATVTFSYRKTQSPSVGDVCQIIGVLWDSDKHCLGEGTLASAKQGIDAVSISPLPLLTWQTAASTAALVCREDASIRRWNWGKKTAVANINPVTDLIQMSKNSRRYFKEHVCSLCFQKCIRNCWHTISSSYPYLHFFPLTVELMLRSGPPPLPALSIRHIHTQL